MSVNMPRVVKSDSTRLALIAHARQMFSSAGYSDVSLDALARHAKVTKGALYHHFKSKRDLYRAVVEAMEQDLVQMLEAAAATTSSPEERLRSYCRTYLDACLDRGYARLLVLEAPVVLGWKAWCDIAHAHEVAAFTERIAELAAAGVNVQARETMALVLLGALNTAARVLGTSDDPTRARARVEETIERILLGFGLPQSGSRPRRPR